MKGKLLKLAAPVSVLAMLTFAGNALATTEAGTTITNTITLDYRIGLSAQPTINAAVDFLVDVRLDVSVAEADGDYTFVAPGATGSGNFVEFAVTNESNATVDLLLSAEALTLGTVSPIDGSETATFQATSLATQVPHEDFGFIGQTWLDEMEPGETRTVRVSGNIPGTTVTDDISVIRLTVTFGEGGEEFTRGDEITSDNAPDAFDPSLVQYVFADPGNDGTEFADDAFKVLGADLTVTKTVEVIEDPINGTTNPKAIPGATLEYTIIVSNAPGAATAERPIVLDFIPANLTYVPGSMRSIHPVANGGAEFPHDDSTSDGAVYNDAERRVRFAYPGSDWDLEGDQSLTFRFRVTID